MALSEHDKARIGDLVAGAGDHFSAHLLRLTAKADTANRAKLAEVYPDEVRAFFQWQAGQR